MANSWAWLILQAIVVVNCFQFSNFVLWQTAISVNSQFMILLWIAFNLVILSYGKQLDSPDVKEINAL